MEIIITVYRPSGKYYACNEITYDVDTPLFKDEFKQFVREHLPAHLSDGIVVV